MAVSDYAQQLKTIEGHFTANYSACPVGFDNVPVLSDGTEAEKQDFIRVSLRGLSKTRLGYGTQFEHSGTILIQIYTAKRAGGIDASTYCDALDTLFDIPIALYQFGEPVRGGSVEESDSQYVQSIYSIDYKIN